MLHIYARISKFASIRSGRATTLMQDASLCAARAGPVGVAVGKQHVTLLPEFFTKEHHLASWVPLRAVGQEPSAVFLNVPATFFVHVAGMAGQDKIFEPVTALLATGFLMVKLPHAFIISMGGERCAAVPATAAAFANYLDDGHFPLDGRRLEPVLVR